MTDWIRVKDELPEEYKHVLLIRTYNDGDNLQYIGYFEGEYHRSSLGETIRPMFTLVLDNDDFERYPKLHNISHWRPLPKPPLDSFS